MGDVCGYSVKPYRYLGPRQAPGEAEQSPEHDRNLFRSSRPGPGKIWWAARGLYYRGPERSHPSLHTLRRSLCSAGAAITLSPHTARARDLLVGPADYTESTGRPA